MEEDGFLPRSKREIEKRCGVCYSQVVMSTLTQAGIMNLSVPERIQLVEDIWDSIAEVPESVALTAEQKEELDRRLDAYHLNPGEGSPWGVVRERIRNRK
jgi:putative addiction module component (TIGR02574 family)